MSCKYDFCGYPTGECQEYCKKDFERMSYEQAVQLWVSHDPFKRASPKLIKMVQKEPKAYKYAQEALL